MIPSESSFIPIHDHDFAEPKTSYDNNAILPHKQIKSFASNSTLEADRSFVTDKDHVMSTTRENSETDYMLHTLFVSKNRIKALLENDESNIILENLLDNQNVASSDCTTCISEVVSIPLSISNIEKYVQKQYAKEPTTGRFIKIDSKNRQTFSADVGTITDPAHYTRIMNVLARTSNVGFTFTYGVLAGFSCSDLFHLQSSEAEMFESAKNYGTNCFYFVSLSLSLTGIIIKRRRYTNASSDLKPQHDKRIDAVAVLMLITHVTALVLTLSSGKLELSLRNYHRVILVGADLLKKHQIWKKLTTTRCAFCVAHWLVHCWLISFNIK